MHLAWSYCQADGFFGRRKTNQLEQFKKEESADHEKVAAGLGTGLLPMMLHEVAQHPGEGW